MSAEMPAPIMSMPPKEMNSEKPEILFHKQPQAEEKRESPANQKKQIIR
jgi:hypothetical protein